MALDIAVAPLPTFEGFVAGRNAVVLELLRAWGAQSPLPKAPIYLWGPAGVGKTHLLRAACQAALARGHTAGWLTAGSAADQGFDPSWDAIVLDEVHRYDSQLQHTAFNWFINALTPEDGRARAVLAAGALPPADLPLREDLRTRLAWGDVFELKPLTDDERKAALRQVAQARGLALTDEVFDYMLSRFARDLGSLTGLLDHLDRYALQARRAITIPLLRAMLEEEAPHAPAR